MLIGLTGGIASGKSTVSRILQDFGAKIIDADKIAHEVLKKGEEGWRRVKNHFGSEILKENEEIDRSYLGKIVFNDSAARKKLESLVHPLIISKIKKEIKRVSGESKIVIVDAPLLYETNLDRLVEEVWVVYVDSKTQLKRLIQRNGLSQTEACNRIKSQMSLEKKKECADVIIDNTGNKDDLYQQLEELWHDVNNN